MKNKKFLSKTHRVFGSKFGGGSEKKQKRMTYINFRKSKDNGLEVETERIRTASTVDMGRTYTNSYIQTRFQPLARSFKKHLNNTHQIFLKKLQKKKREKALKPKKPRIKKKPKKKTVQHARRQVYGKTEKK